MYVNIVGALLSEIAVEDKSHSNDYIDSEQMNPQDFVNALADIHFANTFNPYNESCSTHDLPDAPATRRNILLEMLSSANQTDVDAIWLGRDLGYRGGRRTGLALTDDLHITEHASRWEVVAKRATQGPAVAERTAAVIWNILRQIHSPIFLWNVFPFHPFESGNPFSNRSHNAQERSVGERLLMDLVNMLRPKQIVAIGNDAAKVASRIAGGSVVKKVRHPSYGGQSIFLQQIKALYDI